MLIGIEAAHANKPDRTGVEEYCYRMIQEFKKVIPPDVRVILYSHEPLRAELAQLPGSWQAKLLPWRMTKGWSQVRLAAELRAHPPDIFFAPGQLLPFRMPRRTKTAVMVHDSAFVAYPGAYRFWGRQYLRLMNRLVIHHAQLLLTSAQFNRREIVKFYGAAAGERVRVVPLAYDSEIFRMPPGAPGDILKKYGITAPFIMSVGRLEEKKNTRRIVEALTVLRAQASSLQLVLVGKPGAGYEAVRAAIDRSPYRADIKELGYVPATEVAALLGAARAFVFPSLYEGFGLPLLQAMAVGCPAVVSRGTALEEVAGPAALSVDPTDAGAIAAGVRLFLTDSSERDRYARLGLARAEQFSWRKTAEQTYNALRTMG